MKTPKKRVIAALELNQPKGLVPTLELEFQLTKELLGKEYHKAKVLEKATGKEKERMVNENAQLYVEVAEKLDYSGIMEVHTKNADLRIKTIKAIRKISGDKYFLFAHGDATYDIPFTNLEQFCYDLFDKPKKMKEKARRMVKKALEEGKNLIDSGLDGFALCSDYCDKNGVFLGLKLFDEFIFPFYKDLVKGYKEMGAYVIKHTDGNITPIIDKLIEAEPHALHSLDPSAGVDIKELRQKYGDKVCLIGNVDCHILHKGTKKEVEESAKYALKFGMPKNNKKGGYIFSTSNVVFKGTNQKETNHILENYKTILKTRKKYGKYPSSL